MIITIIMEIIKYEPYGYKKSRTEKFDLIVIA